MNKFCDTVSCSYDPEDKCFENIVGKREISGRLSKIGTRFYKTISCLNDMKIEAFLDILVEGARLCGVAL